MTQRSFGIWDGLFLWALLSNLSRPGAADWFHNHRTDPGYQQWRTEAERQAQDNAGLRTRLDELDRQLAARQDQPRDANYLPPGVTPDVALAQEAGGRTPSTGGDDGVPWTLIAVLAGGVVVGWYFWSRRRQSSPAGSGTTGTLQSAGNMLRHKLSGETYAPSRFRVGMTMSFDPTPFILAGTAIKLTAPATDAGSSMLNVAAVGRLQGQGTELTRLYLPDNRGYFQLHVDASGNPDECRFFARIDEVTPADPGEWDVWLNRAEGLIGWPQFQTKDGKLYDRVWSPGPNRIAPVRLTEAVETTQGTQTVDRQTMLYAAPTGVAPPGPQTEYILVSAIKAGSQAWVEIASGIDVNPAMLALS